ncbi:hypothetical protein LEP1GSC018_0512 [Leptospira kirschneri str. 2008720114]|nr:hypothetical protein LEP1GSC018_0512 [Leptospira kirschneri str. 2008720114]
MKFYRNIKMQEFIPLLLIFIISLFFIFSSFKGEKSYNRK